MNGLNCHRIVLSFSKSPKSEIRMKIYFKDDNDIVLHFGYIQINDTWRQKQVNKNMWIRKNNVEANGGSRKGHLEKVSSPPFPKGEETVKQIEEVNAHPLSCLKPFKNPSPHQCPHDPQEE